MHEYSPKTVSHTSFPEEVASLGDHVAYLLSLVLPQFSVTLLSTYEILWENPEPDPLDLAAHLVYAY